MSERDTAFVIVYRRNYFYTHFLHNLLLLGIIYNACKNVMGEHEVTPTNIKLFHSENVVVFDKKKEIKTQSHE